ncbi:MAG TPA: TadE/TadG family type IV pilus assembly protein [Candidatus Limnocylindrales bacterium]|nr:TadE/TadG family type IV pilus assembly protein [Candidatus Limnocylindrales bacterium]
MSRGRGQSLAEFGLVLPLMLAFLGLTIDFARVFQAWITVESATRDAAELAATDATSSATALTMAQRTICLQAQNIPGFQRSGSPAPADVEQCSAPSISVAFGRSWTAPGASTLHPIGTATVETRLPFSPLFAYPFITQNGVWTIVARESFSIVQGRK